MQDLSLLMDRTFVPLCMDGGTERLQERHNPAWQGMSQNVSAKQAEQRTRERWEWSRKLRIMDKLMNQRYWKWEQAVRPSSLTRNNENIIISADFDRNRVMQD